MRSDHALNHNLLATLQNELRHKTQAEQFERDELVWDAYFKGEDSSDATYATKQAIMQRIFAMINTYKDDNTLGAAQLLSHGERLLIQVPPLTSKNEHPDQFLNMLIGGGDNILSFFGGSDGEKAQAKNKPIFKRPAASHSIKVDEEKKSLVEVRLNPKAIRDTSTFILDAVKLRHLGMNLGLGDTHAAASADGHNGHLYMYWLPPTATTPGGLLLGVEGSEPGKSDRYGATHDASAKSPEFSPTGGLKFTNPIFSELNQRKATLNGGHTLMLSEDHLLEMKAKWGDLPTPANDTLSDSRSLPIMQRTHSVEALPKAPTTAPVLRKRENRGGGFALLGSEREKFIETLAIVEEGSGQLNFKKDKKAHRGVTMFSLLQASVKEEAQNKMRRPSI